MKDLNLYITEKLHLHKGAHLSHIEFPLNIRFWWGRESVSIVRNDLNDLSDIDGYILRSIGIRDKEHKDFWLYEIELDAIDDLYAFLGFICWETIQDTKVTEDNIDGLADGLLLFDEFKENILNKLSISKINDAFQFSLAKQKRT